MGFMEKKPILSGMFGFTVVWVGQVVSLLGTSMTNFALTIWAWEVTGKATALALVGFFSFAPTIFLSPLAGALVDRWNRKFVMMISDLVSGIMTVVALILFLMGALQIWHLYIIGAISGAFQAFQFPAYSAAITTMIPKKHYARASGMLSMADAISSIASPVLAGMLLPAIKLSGIMTIDIITFVFAIGALLMVHVPKPPVTEEGLKAKGSIWEEYIFGFKYIFRKPPLLGLQLIFFVINFVVVFAFILSNPMILARTNNNSVVLGIVRSASGAGALLGGLLLTIWGGPKKKINGVLVGTILSGILGISLLGIARSLRLWIPAAFFSMFFIPIVNGSSQAIWQSKVPPDIQGKVFSARRVIAQITSPIAMLVSGPLADKVFEPLMMSQSRISEFFSLFVGTGRGSGMALMFVIAGILTSLTGLIAYAIPLVRNVEKILPDYDEVIQQTQ